METRENRAFAYEIKFLVPAARAGELRAWTRQRLDPDPNTVGGEGDLYRIASLYYDTYGFDVFHRRGSFARAKYRVRRYGESGLAFLERKLRSQSVVTKRRTVVSLPELDRLREDAPDPAWPGYWFQRRMHARAMVPACQISYHRTALVGLNSTGLVRLTLDDDLRGRRIGAPEFSAPDQATTLLPDSAILELKFRMAMPALFKELLEQFQLESQPVSKYRLAVMALGCAPLETHDAHAEVARA